jgi:tungstate transport system substrate-binding protein
MMPRWRDGGSARVRSGEYAGIRAPRAIRYRRLRASRVLGASLLLLAACSGDSAPRSPAVAVDQSAAPGTDARGRIQLILASTTSTEDSGLLDVLLPAFDTAYPQYAVKLVAVGTGQALELGRRRDADVLLVHDRAAESEFVARGFGTFRCRVMYNDFIIVGPAADPAHVAGLHDAVAAFQRIAAAQTPFVSRGDDSGTHRRERSLWEEARITPDAPPAAWYLAAGQGMGEVLNIASEKRAYTLTDRATFLFMQPKLALVTLVEGDRRLINQYGVIPVDNAHNPEGAVAFAQWITSPSVQEMIASYGVAEFGEPLFTPNADTCTVPRSE